MVEKLVRPVGLGGWLELFGLASCLGWCDKCVYYYVRL
jgi:hypothetical protein